MQALPDMPSKDRMQIAAPSPRATITPALLSRCAALIVILTLLAGCTPPGPRALLQGRRLMDQGKYPEAIEKLQTATVLLGTNALACAQAWNYLGVAYHHAGNSSAAEKAYQRALSLNHDLAEAHYNLGCLCLAENKLEPARTEFTAYTLRRGNSPEGFLKLGAVQLRARDSSGAEKNFTEALRLSPQNPEAFNGLGLARLQQRRTADAVDCFNNALKVPPTYRPALLNLAIVAHHYLKDRPLALQKYREYLALKPPPPNVESVTETVRELEQELNPPARTAAATPPAPAPAPSNPAPPKLPATNVTHSASAPKTQPATNVPKSVVVSKPPPLAAAAPVSVPPSTTAVEVVRLPSEPALHSAQDIPSPAPPPQVSRVDPSPPASSAPVTAPPPKPPKRGFLDRVNPLNLFHSGERPPHLTPLPSSSPPGSAAPASALTTASSTAQTPASATASRYHYKTPAAPAPGDRAAAQRSFEQAIQAQQGHRLLDAVQAYQQATQADPAFFEAQYNLGLAATDAGNLGLSLNAYEVALAIRPDSADARYNFALVLKQARCFADAANELEKLVAAHPNEARAHLALANLYAQQLSQPAQARRHYLKVLEIDPHNPQAGPIRFWLAANPA